MAVVKRDLILLTGATGFVGFRVLVKALEAGYAVRCAIQDPSDIKKILMAPSIKGLKVTEHQLFWTFVPNNTSSNAYDNAVKDVKYILHCTTTTTPALEDDSPKWENRAEGHIKSAIQGVVGLLDSAAIYARNTLKRVVVTSSLVAILSPEYFTDGLEKANNSHSDSDSRVPIPPRPFHNSHTMSWAGKIAALNASETWAAENQPKFDLVTLLPAPIYGLSELAGTPDELLGGHNGLLLRPMLGKACPMALYGAFVALEDVADAHVLSMGSAVPGNRAYILSMPLTWDEAVRVAHRQFPEAFAKNVFRGDVAVDLLRVHVDDKKVAKMMGLQFREFGETVKQVVHQYLRLVEEESNAVSSS